MIYLSANGTVLGQYEESALPAMLSNGTITNEAFFWRVGMSEWRPVTELAMPPVPETKPPLPKLVPSPVQDKSAAANALPDREAVPHASAPGPHSCDPPKTGAAAGRRHAVVEIRAGEGGDEDALLAADLYRAYQRSAESLGFDIDPVNSSASDHGGFKHIVFKVLGSAVAPSAAASPAKPQIPRRVLSPAAALAPKLAIPERKPANEATKPAETNPVPTAAPASILTNTVAGNGRAEPAASRTDDTAPGGKNVSPANAKDDAGKKPTAPAKSGFRFLRFLFWFLLLTAAAGGGTWWWLNRPPAAISGNVPLSGDETSPAKIRVFAREELAAAWREQLAVADARRGDLENLAAEAEAELREKSLLHDEAARVCQVGEEYNMPDVDKLRADRDAKKADVDAAQTKLDQVKAEKGDWLAMETLLENVPAPVQTLAADGSGNFTLPPPEGVEAVLLATVPAEAEGRQETRGWMLVLDSGLDGGVPPAVQFSEENRLDMDDIRGFAATASP